jgi:hypothetical protein
MNKILVTCKSAGRAFKKKMGFFWMWSKPTKGAKRTRHKLLSNKSKPKKTVRKTR